MDQSNRILDKLDKIDEKFDRKLDKADRRIDNIEKELAIYNEQLKYHIEGVRQLKTFNELLRNYIDVEINKLEKKLEPVINHVVGMTRFKDGTKKVFQWLSYILTIAATIAGLIYSIVHIGN